MNTLDELTHSDLRIVIRYKNNLNDLLGDGSSQETIGYSL